MSLFGRLTLDAVPHDTSVVIAMLFMACVGVALLCTLTYYGLWRWLWKEWLTSLDPKKIGVMYIAVALVMLFRGLVDASMMRAQQAVAASSPGYLEPTHFEQIFTAHGVIMIFFVAMPFMFGLINLIVPLQIGARDVAFPFLNSVSFWLFAAGAMLVNLSLVLGEFAATGWLAYPPLSEIPYNPGVGVDYWIWSLQISGFGSLFSGINFIATILKMRAPGMSLIRMPVFTWTALSSMMLVVVAFPILTVTLSLLFLDRFAGMHFFTSDLGGNVMMYVNLIWAWGHPEVYIVILPAFGIFSEIVPVFSQKRLFGYRSMIVATLAITILSFLVWVHHFFTMGAGAAVNAFFGIMTMVIAIPTGVKIFNWLFTMFRGRIIFATPMLWFLGFVVTFTIGGAAGVLMSIPAADFELHNSLFLVAHFHTMLVGGVLFGYFAGLTYWFPKIFGFKLNERLGTYAFWFWIIGFLVAFIPLYILGFMGATRRLESYDAATGWQPLFIVAGIGLLILIVGALFQVIQLIYSIRVRKNNLDVSGDPWNGRTLEWSVPSPAPFYNFAATPHVYGRDAFWAEKHSPSTHQHALVYEDIYLPKNTALGLYIAGFGFIACFGLIWHMLWMVPIGFCGMLACVIMRSLAETEYRISGHDVERMAKKHPITRML